MRRQWFLFILAPLLVTLNAAWACESDGCISPLTVPVPLDRATISKQYPNLLSTKRIENPFYYRITTRDGKTSYLLGTMHIGIGIDQLPATVTADFLAAKKLVGEIRFENLEVQKNFLKNPEKFMWESITKKYREISEEEARKVRLVDYETLTRLVQLGTPYSVAVFLRADEDANYFQLFPYYTYGNRRFLDLEYQILADHLKKPIESLETLNERESIWSEHDKIKSPTLGEAYGATESMHRTLSGMDAFMGAYKRGDDAFFSNVKKDKSSVLRNHLWLPRLEKIVEEGDAFIAVGANHLFGEAGLIEELRSRGYIVERYSVPNPQ